MLDVYLKWNEKSFKWLWWLVILGVLSALPLAYERWRTEQTARQVEFVFDYRDLLDIADYKPNPAQFVEQQLEEIKKAGIGSIAVYESSLAELKLSRHIEVFSSHEAYALTQAPPPFGENYTYILFKDAATQRQLQPVIERAFARIHVNTRPWSYKNQPGMVVELNVEDASLKPLDPNPIAMRELKDKGFHLVVRLSNRMQPFSAEEMDALLSRLSEFGVSRIIFDGASATGYSYYDQTPDDLKEMARLLNKHNIGLAAIELLKEQQKGFQTLARETGYNVVRLHSFTERDGERLAGNVTHEQLAALVRGVADRFVLAVTDRNIRMIFLNAKPIKNTEKGIFTDALQPIYDSLQGPDGAIERIKREGFAIGPAKPMAYVHSGWQKAAKAVMFLACVALIALTLACFFRKLLLALFVVGAVGSAGLYVLSGSLYAQTTALAVGICAPTLGVILALRSAGGKTGTAGGSAGWFAVRLLLRTVLFSLVGSLFVVGLLNNITYFLVLEQYRGVSLLHIAPIALAAAYLVFFHTSVGYADLRSVLAKVRHILYLHVRVLWVVVAAVAAAVIVYYLSRTGNAGQAGGWELAFRSFLEETLKVRPRTKEFLIAHPLFILGAYLAWQYRNSRKLSENRVRAAALYLIVLGVIGQLSIVDTFAHLHTPLVISLIRAAYGVIFGIVVGFVLIGCWKLAARGWSKWAHVRRP